MARACRRIYLKIVLPSLRPVFFSAVMILAHIAIKSFDLVAAMTAGGPGYSSDLPAMFMYSFTFSRGQMGMGSASAMLMLGADADASSCRTCTPSCEAKRHD